MRKYCKAYPLQELRRFQHWQENASERASSLADETIVYVWDDFTVVESPILDQGNLVANVTAEWQDFCTQTLQFAIPEDLQYAYKTE